MTAARRLAVDIGTNGEMALLHDGRTYACSRGGWTGVRRARA